VEGHKSAGMGLHIVQAPGTGGSREPHTDRCCLCTTRPPCVVRSATARSDVVHMQGNMHGVHREA
jgi:hypothetical protein